MGQTKTKICRFTAERQKDKTRENTKYRILFDLHVQCAWWES